jgi:hypothetical protein
VRIEVLARILLDFVQIEIELVRETRKWALVGVGYKVFISCIRRIT